MPSRSRMYDEPKAIPFAFMSSLFVLAVFFVAPALRSSPLAKMLRFGTMHFFERAGKVGKLPFPLPLLGKKPELKWGCGIVSV